MLEPKWRAKFNDGEVRVRYEDGEVRANFDLRSALEEHLAARTRVGGGAEAGSLTGSASSAVSSVSTA